MGMSEYLTEIRSLVGSRRLLLTAASLIITDDDGRLLLGRSIESGSWVTVGGMIEPFESPAEAAIREAKEEIGADVELGPLLGAFGGPGYEVTYGNGHLASYVIVAYQARLLSSPSPDGLELCEIAWFHPDGLPVAHIDGLNRDLLRDLGYLQPLSAGVH